MVAAAKLFGRDLEAAALHSLLDGLPNAGGAVTISGDAGMGKTALAEVAIESAARRNIPVLSASASEVEARLPFAALEDLLRSHMDTLPLLRARQRDALKAALGLSASVTPDVYLVGLAVLDLLSEIGGDTGVLVIIDDVHWIDASTARVLGFVGRRLRTEPVAMVLTMRPEYATPVLDSLSPVFALETLSESHSLALMADARPDLERWQQRRVLDLANGNPLALLELSPSHAHPDETGHVMTQRLQRAFAVQYEELSEQARVLLLVSAISDSGAIGEIVDAARLCAGGSEVHEDALDEAAATRAIAVRDGVVRFRHPLVRSAIVESARGSELREAHAALAETLTDSADRAAWHLAASVVGPDERAGAALETVADHAKSQGNPAVMLRALLIAARISVLPDARARRLLRAAESAIDLGQTDRAGDIARQVDPASLSVQGQARLALLYNLLDSTAHNATRVAQLVSHGESALDADDFDLAVALLLAAGAHLNQSSFGIDSSVAKKAARRLATAIGEDDPRALAVLGAIDPLPYAELTIARVAAMDISRLDSRMELLVSAAFAVDADPALARLQTAVVDSYRVRGRLQSIAHLQAMHCWTHIALANWPDAIQAADEGVRLSREVSLGQRESGAMIGQAMIAAIRGDDVGAGRLIAESESIAMARGAHDVLTGVQLTKGIHLISLGRHDEAVSALKRVFDPTELSHHPLQSNWSLGDLAEAGYHSGRLPEVVEIFRRIDLQEVSTPWQKMAQEYARPFLARDADEMEAAFSDVLSGVVGRWPAYRVRLMLEYGRWLRRQRRVSEGRDMLRIARESADALSMRPWSERARQELRAAGEDSAVFRPKVWELLSPQELQVAQMASAGLSNKDIAERLFLSHRTVGSHLYRIYPKLGIANRAQLAAMVGATQLSL